MKLLLTIAMLISVCAHADVPEIAERLSGAYVADANCAFDRAEVKIERESSMDFLVVRLKNPTLGLYKSQSVNLDNLWTKVRTTRGFQRIIIQDRIRGNVVIAEEKTCLPGWLGCSEFRTVMKAELTSQNTMEVRMGEQSCVFKRVEI